MNERMTRNLLEQARSSLEPTDADRERLRGKVMGAVGAGAVVTAAAAAAASTAGAASSGLPISALTILKLSVGGLLIGGAAVFTALSMPPSEVPAPHAAVEDSGLEHSVNAPKRPVLKSATVEEIDTTPTLQEVESGAAIAAPPSKIFATHPIPKERKSHKDTEIDGNDNNVPQNDDALLQELALIRTAAKALADDDPQKASILLAQYDRQFQNGIMQQERDGLEISVLCRLGHEPAAKRAERQFKLRYPTAPLAIRVDEGCRSNDVGTP